MNTTKPTHFGQGIMELSSRFKALDDVQPSDSFGETSGQLDAAASEYRKQLADKPRAALEIFASKILAAQLKLLDEHAETLAEFSRQIDFFENLIPQLNAHWAKKAATQISHARVQLAKAGGHARHATDPKQAVKQQVRECWDDWKNGLRSYKSKSAFARDMLDKFPTQKDEKGRQTGLENQRVIERWCKKWESETSQQSTYPAS